MGGLGEVPLTDEDHDSDHDHHHKLGTWVRTILALSWNARVSLGLVQTIYTRVPYYKTLQYYYHER